MRKNLVWHTAGAAALALVSGTAMAGPTRGYVVSYMIPAMYTTDVKQECPNGMNPDGPHLLERILRAEGKSDAEVKAGIDADSFDMYKMAQLSTFRGRIDGKPADIFLHPMSDVEPLQTSQGKFAIGFNLDGTNGPDKLVDPITHETGVNNQMSKVLGCTDLNRGTPESRGKAAYSNGRGGLAWLISIDGADNMQNAAHVTVRITRALQNVVRGSKGIQKNITYTIDGSDTRMQKNVYHGHIKDGTFVSDEPVDFFMSTGNGFEDFKRSHLRMSFLPDGTLLAFLGGFESIPMTYARESTSRGIGEQEGQSKPAIYQTMVRLADTDIDKDPVTGMRTRISSTYQLGAVPAFVRTRDNSKPVS
jgi:hypothetical protein